jgi:hypothetical protein
MRFFMHLAVYCCSTIYITADYMDETHCFAVYSCPVSPLVAQYIMHYSAVNEIRHH